MRVLYHGPRGARIRPRPGNPQFPFPPFPILPGNGEGIPDSRLGRNRETGNARFAIRPGTGIGVPIRRAGDFLVCPGRTVLVQ
jgi:hypothetical protein